MLVIKADQTLYLGFYRDAVFSCLGVRLSVDEQSTFKAMEKHEDIAATCFGVAPTTCQPLQIAATFFWV
ncbi:hypothetical protein A252_14266 [Pseudomonas syringae pv. actinidiae ICMP 9855]|nr:hypothetical protein A260_14251 [Pseudomonas syringae pv. actinidiae ICMP 19068]EPN10277.1 hypothetical protein A252_14266 [Pseudomonas syringae pv. actinidiae ICMP 9855]